MGMYNKLIAGLLSLVLISCKTGSKVTTASYVGKEFVTESGLKYTIHKAGTGARPTAGELVSVHYVGRLSEGMEFDNSYKRGAPIRFALGEGKVIKGWDEGIELLNVGDSATITVPPHLAYGSKEMGPIPANSTLIFDVELISIDNVASPWEVQGLDTMPVAEGLKMIKITSNASGIMAENGKNVYVHYSGYFRNWKKFDSSVDRGEPFVFEVGKGMVIKGWDIGIAQLRTGEKARLIVSPEMGYGLNGYGNIPPNATLFFDVELMDVK